MTAGNCFCALADCRTGIGGGGGRRAACGTAALKGGGLGVLGHLSGGTSSGPFPGKKNERTCIGPGTCWACLQPQEASSKWQLTAIPDLVSIGPLAFHFFPVWGAMIQFQNLPASPHDGLANAGIWASCPGRVSRQPSTKFLVPNCPWDHPDRFRRDTNGHRRQIPPVAMEGQKNSVHHTDVCQSDLAPAILDPPPTHSLT